MKQRLTLAGLVGLLVLAGAGLVWLRAVDSSRVLTSDGQVEYESVEAGVRFVYPADYKQAEVDEQVADNGMIFRALQDAGQGMFSVRRENGLGVLRLTGGILDTLVTTATRRYESLYPEYRKEAFEERMIAENPGAVLEFTYLGTDGRTRIRQRLLFILVNDERAYLVSFQAPDEDFAAQHEGYSVVETSFEVLPNQR